MEAEVTNVKTFAVEFLWQRCEVPDFKVALAELDGLDSFEFRLLDEQLDLAVIHTVVLVVFEVFLLLLLVNGVLLARNLAGIDTDEMFRDPAVEPPIKTKIMHIVFISQAIAKVLNEFSSWIDGVV